MTEKPNNQPTNEPAIAPAQDAATISIYCPPMAIYADGPGHKRTAAEPMVATIKFPDLGELVIPNVVIPPTEVVRIRPWYWQVAPCVGVGEDKAGNSISVFLPAEQVLFDLRKMTMVAQAITAVVGLMLASDEHWTGYVVFPDCPTNLLARPETAEAVTAVGTLTKAKE